MKTIKNLTQLRGFYTETLTETGSPSKLCTARKNTGCLTDHTLNHYGEVAPTVPKPCIHEDTYTQ